MLILRKNKKNITKKLVLRLAFFIAVIGVATLFDLYFESDAGILEEIQNESAANAGEQSNMYFVSQTNTINALGNDGEPIFIDVNFDAINITLGLPFTRISPDHGPNHSMLGKNLSDPKSLIQALKFLDK